MAALVETSENMAVTSGFKNPDGSDVLPGYHIIFNPQFADLCFMPVMNTIDRMAGGPFNPLTQSSRGGRVHGADIFIEWSQNNNAGYVNGVHYPNYYSTFDDDSSSSSSANSESESESDSDSSSMSVDDDEGTSFTPVPRVGQANFDENNSQNTCIANGSNDWMQWSRAINSIQRTTGRGGKNLCMDVLDTEGFFEHERMQEKCQIIILKMGANGRTDGFICITDLREIVQERLRFQNSDAAHYMKDNDGDEVLHGENYLYIDGLCSNQRGVGMELTDKVIEMTFHASNIYQGVKLASLPYVVKYYWDKFCFRFRPGCYDSGTAMHPRDAFKSDDEGKKYLYLNDTANKIPSRNPEGKVWTDETMFSDPIYSKFLLSLNEVNFEPGVIQPSGAPSLRSVGAKKPPGRKRVPPERLFGKTDYERWREDHEAEYMHHIFGANWKKLKISDKIKQQIIDASFAADKDGTTPVGEGIYMYLCFNTHRKPTVSMTLGYPSFRPSPFVKYLLENSKSPFDNTFNLRKRGGKKKKRRTKKKEKRTRKKRGGEPSINQTFYANDAGVNEGGFEAPPKKYKVTKITDNMIYFNDTDYSDEENIEKNLLYNYFTTDQTEQPGGRKKKIRNKKKRKTKQKKKRKRKSRKKRK